jgi:hypothetical protein
MMRQPEMWPGAAGRKYAKKAAWRQKTQEKRAAIRAVLPRTGACHWDCGEPHAFEVLIRSANQFYHEKQLRVKHMSSMVETVSG